jgi:hypothetical protein
VVFQALEGEGKEEPKPIVLIDQDSDAEATTVEISFGNRLGALLDTVGHPLTCCGIAVIVVFRLNFCGLEARVSSVYVVIFLKFLYVGTGRVVEYFRRPSSGNVDCCKWSLFGRCFPRKVCRIWLSDVLRTLWTWHDAQIKALQDLGLNVVRGVVTTEDSGLRRKKFLVTRLYVKHFPCSSSLPQNVAVGHVPWSRGSCWSVGYRSLDDGWRGLGGADR